MNIWHDISESRVKKDDFVAVIEIPKGCGDKYELDKETGMLRLDRVLYTATHYPANYGFIPRTYAGDKDPLDVLVICQESVYPLTLIDCYPIGVLKMIDSNEQDEKIIAIAKHDPYLNCYKDISELPKQISDELMHFFEVYKQLEGKKTTVDKMYGREEAEKIISAIKECCNLTQIENKKIEENKNKISKQFEEKIQDNIKVAVKVFNENGKNINKWKEAFNNKNFMKMEKIYKEIEKNKVNTVSIEENIKELKKIENMHLLIKRKGGDFNLTNEELELVEKLT